MWTRNEDVVLKRNQLLPERKTSSGKQGEIISSIIDLPDHYHILIEVPGVKRHQFDLIHYPNFLKVVVKSKQGPSPFLSKNFLLPTNVQSGSIKSRYVKGILKITFNKTNNPNENLVHSS